MGRFTGVERVEVWVESLSKVSSTKRKGELYRNDSLTPVKIGNLNSPKALQEVLHLNSSALAWN